VATEELLDFFLNEAYKLRASDIHFEPEDTNVRIRLRIDGYLQVYKIMSKQHWEYLSARIKVCAGMNSAEKRKPQSGRFSERICGVELDIRVGSHPTINGESIVLRLLDKHKVVVPLDSLGFDSHSLNLLRQIYSHPQGLVLFTGPTGSGKTTTLYSILNQLNSGNINIMTLEDPVEYELKGVRQTSVQEGVLSFKEGIRAMLRQDPDVILIGEIRDEDTAKMCFRASQTGHLVFSTLHTNNVFGVFPRLMDFGISFESIKQTLVGVASQRLIRKVCVKCKGVGCKSCKETGLLGRTAIGEFLLLTNEVRAKLSSANLYNICDDLSGDVYISLEESANQAVSLGMTTDAEIIKYSGA
jgi:type II secretory ATPase GspE/PulE/Tfp pilus assembly ATPase PilB-like protein